MGTESLVRILGNSDRWQAIKGSPRYRPSTSEMAIEGLDFLTLRDQQSQIQDKDVMPNRSDSAPPSMEGSLVAMANIVPHCKINSALFPDSSSPIKSHANGEKNSKLSRDKLPSHEEESEDDHLCVSGYRSQSLDSMQDTSQASSPSSQKPPKNEQLVRQNSGPPIQAPPQHLNTSRVLDSSSQIIYPALTHAYGGSNQLHQNPSNIPMAYMASQGPFYYNIPATGFFGLQYTPGVYNLNSTILPSYVPGYPHQGGTFPMAFNGANFYGRVGVPLQPPPFHFQNFQLPVRDPYDSYGHLNHQTPRDNINPVNFHDSKKGSQHLSGYKNLNLQLGNMSGQQPKPAAVSITSLSHSSVDNPSRMSGQSPAWKDANLNYFLEELKSGNGQRLELSDLEGYIVEFSVDQHGSRFIQQKLVTCSIEEKASVFKEVIPHASKLITDVFGNYVVQKLFEHGNSVERMNLSDQLKGQILPLSLQMYGCRVIQKALDVIDLEQKTRLIRELDGHVLRCVRDQNGNHVIQKCIETIPIDNIHFIVSSFRGQVGSLSFHPYGCRVIQRFLEHYSNNLQTKFIVDEILDSVCLLAQDQYGNYVTQHALERGNPHERTRIIEKLGGSIVQLSQHKFASNVIEKCLEYSDSDAREMLIKEIIGDGNNDNLLVMMKDQYANYVIQRILEKCSNDHREVLLSQIKGHLTVLKKYTYGKHIVSRFEKLYGEGLVSKETPS